MTQTQQRGLGCHVSISGGFENGIKNGAALGVDTIQVHPCAPQRWNFKPFADGFEDAFLEARKNSGITRVFFHGIYLINLANPDPKQFGFSKTSLQHDLQLCARIHGEGIIFHVGSLKHAEDEASGLQQAAEGLNYILSKTPEQSRLLLEVSAGSGSVIGSRMEQLAAIYDKVEQKTRVGFALDTQHMWASGYDIKGNLEAVVKNIGDAFSFDKVWAIHLNDSKTALASRIDRHANLGEGEIGADALEAFINHPNLRHIPVILETPGLKEAATAKVEVEKLRALAVN
jgi:deoxyribonuclease-4